MNPNSLFVVGLSCAIGIGCRGLGIPVPAPTAFPGALPGLAITFGFLAGDRTLG
jgi:XapX domain-containing protein